MTKRTGFDISDFIDCLTPAKGKNRYFCPVCNGNDFTVSEEGAYSCWHGCAGSNIKAALRRRKKAKGNGHSPTQSRKRRKSRGPAPAPIPDKIELAQLPERPSAQQSCAYGDRPSPEKPRWKPKELPKSTVEIRYWYSQTQWVTRFQWEDPENPKGRDKTFRQGHIKPDGSSKWSKGSDPWQPYRFDEVQAHAKGKWIMLVEGEECVEDVRQHLELVAITLQGSSWSEPSIKEALSRLKEAEVAGVIFPRDNDDPGQNKAKKVLTMAAQVKLPCLVLEPIDVWSDMPHKGDITDWIKWGRSQEMNQEKFIARLERIIHAAVERRRAAYQFRNQNQKQQGDHRSDSDNWIPFWSQSDISAWLAEQYRPQLAWNTAIKEWYRYSAKIKDIWGEEPSEYVWQIIISEIDEIAESYEELNGNKPTYTANFIQGIEKLLKAHLAVRKWNETPGLLPMLNGVVNLETKELLPHAPSYHLTWCLPYEYDEKATCEPIQEWLLSMCNGDEKLVEFDRAYLNAVVNGRTDLESFLELIGPGGTGKSTLIRLAMALVGLRNTHTTTLKKLESSRFETANIEGKRLVVVTDSERYSGPVSILKALTGEDSLPYEKKFKQGTSGFFPDAMVIIAANELPQSGDYTSGLERRRKTQYMTNRIPPNQQRNLLSFKRGQIRGEFAQYIPGLLNWVLAMEDSEVTLLIKDHLNQCPAFPRQKAEALVETNPIADWLDHAIVYRQGHRCNVGVAARDKKSDSQNWYQRVDTWLYANYAEYSHNTGSKGIGVRRFVNLLHDLCLNQLHLSVFKGRDRNGSYFEGLKIRTPADSDPLLITGKPSPPPPPAQPPGGGGTPPPKPNSPPSPPSPPEQQSPPTTDNTGTHNPNVTDSVTDSVTDKTLTSEECYGCDGRSSILVKIENKSALSEDDTTKDQRGDINSSDPSYQSQQSAESTADSELAPIPNPSQHSSQSITASVTQAQLPNSLTENCSFIEPDCAKYAEQLEAIKNAPLLSLDIETYGENKREGLHPRRGKIRLIQLGLPDTTYICDLGGRLEDREQRSQDLAEFFEVLRDSIQNPDQRIVGHNLLFDLRFLATQYGIRQAQNVACTLLGLQVYFGDAPSNSSTGKKKHAAIFKGGYGLANAVEKLLGVKLDKTYQTSDFGQPLTSEQLSYATSDAYWALKLYEKLEEIYQDESSQLYSPRVREIWSLENQVIAPTIEVELAGLPLDTEELGRQKTRLIEIKSSLEEEWQQLVPGIKYTQRDKLLQHLNETYHLNLNSLTKADLANHKNNPVVTLRRKLEAIAIKLNQLEAFERSAGRDGRVHTIYRTLTGFGRFSSGGGNCSTRAVNDLPNLQSIGAKSDPILKEYDLSSVRKCIRPEPGKVMAVIDLAGAHGRIAADQAADPVAIAGNNDPSVDNHSKVAAYIAKAQGFDWDWQYIKTAKEDKTHPDHKLAKSFRDTAKNTYYGWLNGAGADRIQEQIAANTGQKPSLEDCKAAIAGCVALYPKVVSFRKALMKELKQSSVTVFGQPISINAISDGSRICLPLELSRYHPDKLEPAYTQNLACIWSRIEATAMKNAFIQVCAKAQQHPEWELKVINVVHDELDLEVNSRYATDAITAANNIVGDCFKAQLKYVDDGREINWKKLTVKSWADK